MPRSAASGPSASPATPVDSLRKSSLKRLNPLRLQAFLGRLCDEDADFLLKDWFRYARDEQLPPQGAWRIWLFLGGRGAGKTRSGAQWIAEGVAEGAMRRIGLIGATFNDARAVMIEGSSGLRSVSVDPKFAPSLRRVSWSNGAIATVLSADEPDGIRGHQFDAIWAGEFA